jgi:hypothetical protein
MRTEFRKGGTAAPLRWGWWHIGCFTAAAAQEGVTLHGHHGPYTFTEAHRFTDPDDGEVLIIAPGDQFHAWYE